MIKIGLDILLDKFDLLFDLYILVTLLLVMQVEGKYQVRRTLAGLLKGEKSRKCVDIAVCWDMTAISSFLLNLRVEDLLARSTHPCFLVQRTVACVSVTHALASYRNVLNRVEVPLGDRRVHHFAGMSYGLVTTPGLRGLCLLSHTLPHQVCVQRTYLLQP